LGFFSASRHEAITDLATGIAMHRLFLATALLTVLSVATPTAWSQLPDSVQRSSSPQGFQVQGSGPAGTTGAKSTGASSVGKESAGTTAAATTGKSSVQIQGNTRINAAATGTTATALGQGNKAGNDLGAIGGK
jgi:hypothetical protein